MSFVVLGVFLSFVNRALLEGQEDQSILISGVSGAGKTETAKLLLGHLASVAGSEEGGVGSERIQHMVECTVVLESFGNAVMVSSVRPRDYSQAHAPQYRCRLFSPPCRWKAFTVSHKLRILRTSTRTHGQESHDKIRTSREAVSGCIPGDLSPFASLLRGMRSCVACWLVHSTVSALYSQRWRFAASSKWVWCFLALPTYILVFVLYVRHARYCLRRV